MKDESEKVKRKDKVKLVFKKEFISVNESND
jgi:hypothetical protein